MEEALHDIPRSCQFAGLDTFENTIPDATTPLKFRHLLEANALLHGEEKEAFGDACYQGAEKRPDATHKVRWNVAMRPGKCRGLDKSRKSTLKSASNRLVLQINSAYLCVLTPMLNFGSSCSDLHLSATNQIEALIRHVSVHLYKASATPRQYHSGA